MVIIFDYIIFLFIIVSKLVTGQNFQLMRYAGQRLEVTYNTLETVSPIHCNALCKRESICRSVNYNTITGECQPSEIGHGDVVGNSVTDPDWDVYTLRACGEPPKKGNSNVLPGDNTVGSHRQYQCNAPYVPATASEPASMTTTCLETGYWTSTSFQCVIECPEPAGKPNALLLPGPPPAVNLDGDIRTYQCNSGYTPLPGSDEVEITCQNDGCWSDIDLVCVIDCDSPSAMPNGAWSGTTHEGSVVTYTCDARYSPSPTGADTTITCQASGAWTKPSFSCQVASIGMSCLSDSDCLEVNSRCLFNQNDLAPRRRCLCNYKTEYNEASRSCDTQCTTYSDTFTEYSGKYIAQYNHVAYSSKTKDECLQACIDYGETCASVDYWTTNKVCSIGSASYQQIVDGDPSQIVNDNQNVIYTRDCSNG